MDDDAAEQALPAFRLRGPAPVDVGEEARELDDHGERQEHADDGYLRVVDHRVRETRRTERGGDGREQDHRPAVRQAVVHEPVRAVVAAALVERAPLEQSHDRDERRIQDRDGEDEQGQDEGRDRRLSHLQGRRDAARGEREAEDLAAGVAHEDPRGPLAAQVEGQERDAGAEQRERDDEDGDVRVQRCGVDREEQRGDRGEHRGEAVHVVEHVERVRQPDQPQRREREGEPVIRDDRHLEAGREDYCRGAELDDELDDRRHAEDVVEHAGDEEHRAARDDPEHLLVRAGDRADGDRCADSDCEAGEDADAAEVGRRPVVPAVLARRRGEALRRRRPQEQVQDERCNGIRDECRGCTHSREPRRAVLGGCLVIGRVRTRSYTRWGS